MENTSQSQGLAQGSFFTVSLIVRIEIQRGMTHQKLDRAQVDTGLQKMRGEASTKTVNTTALLSPALFFAERKMCQASPRLNGPFLARFGKSQVEGR